MRSTPPRAGPKSVLSLDAFFFLREPRVPDGMAARAEQAELANPAARRGGGDPAPSCAVKMASQDRGVGGASYLAGDKLARAGASCPSRTCGALAHASVDIMNENSLSQPALSLSRATRAFT